jgi:hypothetical protein
LDAELNLPDGRYSLELRRRVAEEASKSSYDETVESIGKTTGAKIGKRQVEELVQRAACDFDDFYRLREQEVAGNPPGSSILVLSVDGKGVKMRTEHLREKTRKAAEARRHKMEKRLSKGEKKNAKRMATVAAVYTIAPFVRESEQIVDGDRCSLARRPGLVRRESACGRAWKKSPQRSLSRLLPRPARGIRRRRKPGWPWSTARGARSDGCAAWPGKRE